MLEKKEHNYEKAILVGVVTQHQDEEKLQEYMDELEFLAMTAGAETYKRFFQKLPHPDVKFYVGKGKMEEIVEYVRAKEIDQRRAEMVQVAAGQVGQQPSPDNLEFQYIITALFSALAVAFWVFQVAQHQKFRQMAEENHMRKLPLPAPRQPSSMPVICDEDSAARLREAELSVSGG